ncbi:MAG: alpha-amylase [Porphyromonadaceae bacterium]|nr:alpha-amylase [Porphyromonadaceae bacterium]
MKRKKTQIVAVYFLFAALALLISCGNQPGEKKKEVTATGKHPEWVYDAVIYEVNTRQYTPEGTFNAFAANLPRLKELGVDILWFMPIQPIGEKDRKGNLGSYYSIKNYTGINEEFGTLDDFKAVVRKAHDLDMRVILDWVANHTSRDAVWVDAHPEWYVRDSLGNLNVMYDWTDIAQLDYNQPPMRAAMIAAMQYWIRETGIDGFRCDVAGEIPTDFWTTAKDSLTALNPDIFLLAEAEKPELNETAFDAYYAWDFHHKMNMVAQGKENADSLRASLQRMHERFAPYAVPMFFTSNHDENSWSGTEFERMGEAAKTFAALTYVLPGIPLIYSGQEAGFNRRLQFFEKDLIDWTDPQGFTAFYQKLNEFRKQHKALQTPEKAGELSEIANDRPESVWSFRRTGTEDEIVAVFNLSNKPVAATFHEEIPGKEFFSFPDSSAVTGTQVMEFGPWEYKIYFK